MSDSNTHSQLWQVPKDLAGTRADRAISAAFPEWSRSQIQKWIETQAIRSSSRELKANTPLLENEQIQICPPQARPLELTPENIPIEILYQDDHIAIVNKPPGLTVHPSETQQEGTLVHALLFHIKDLSGIGGVQRPGIVHRIDKDTSGALVITKTDAAHQVLSQVFAEHRLQRQYWALCFGAPDGRRIPSKGKIETLIGRHPTDRKKMSSEVKEGRKAITHYRVLETFQMPHQKAPFACLIEATLETGRTHQVRVHLTGLGHSLLGDPVYGTPSERAYKWEQLPKSIQKAVRELPGQALHARTLGFKHPITEVDLQFEAALPIAFSQLMTALEEYKVPVQSSQR
jgi:23S rRNA pseudouridine1911/1915/1917 synthase